MTNKNSSFQEKIKNTDRHQWIWLAVWITAIALFAFWAQTAWVFILIPPVFDIYITKFVPWTFWKKSKNPIIRRTMEWVDAILFALVAVYFINTFFFQNYQIPTSSLEKSLLVGDFLAVSKLSYGPRAPMTPLSFPLAQHTMPVIGGKSYLDKPQWRYRRLRGFGNVKRDDIVVFNFPAGDTVALNVQGEDFYSLALRNPLGSAGVRANVRRYGEVVFRPVDRRENYVKRAIGLPGETIELRNDSVFINDGFIPNPPLAQHNYTIQTDGTIISPQLFEELGINKDDYLARDDFGRITQLQKTQEFFGVPTSEMERFGLQRHDGNNGRIYYNIPMTQAMVESLRARSFVWTIVKENDHPLNTYYPINHETEWTRSDYGPLWIPKRGSTVYFDTDVAFKAAVYERPIKNYEGNDFEFRNGSVYINGQVAESYTFKFDYYFMMGDNRHNSLDSRAWGFVPEDHIVGQPMLIWLSLEKDNPWFGGRIRWNRLFRNAKK
jgi:signal peptidase I